MFRHAKHPELANLTRSLIFIGDSPADELKILRIRRVGKHPNLCRDPFLHEVGSFESASATGIKSYDDDVGRRDRFLNNEGRAQGPQDLFTNCGNTGDDSRDQRNYCNNPGPTWPSKSEARIHVHIPLGTKRGQ